MTKKQNKVESGVQFSHTPKKSSQITIRLLLSLSIILKTFLFLYRLVEIRQMDVLPPENGVWIKRRFLIDIPTHRISEYEEGTERRQTDLYEFRQYRTHTHTHGTQEP